jgi:CheY-like chemotaxis protein
MDLHEISNSAAAAEPQSILSTGGVWAGRTILVVDDFPEMTSLVADVFTNAGAKVRQVQRGADALPLLSRGAFDILILDLAMPQINGYLLLRFLKRRHPESLARTIVLTATNPGDHQALAELEKYQVATLFKPFAIAQLLRTACHLLS